MLDDAEAKRVMNVSIDLFFSNNVYKIEELVDRVFAEGGLRRFPKTPKSFEKMLRMDIMVDMLEESARWN